MYDKQCTILSQQIIFQSASNGFDLNVICEINVSIKRSNKITSSMELRK